MRFLLGPVQDPYTSNSTKKARHLLAPFGAEHQRSREPIPKKHLTTGDDLGSQRKELRDHGGNPEFHKLEVLLRSCTLEWEPKDFAVQVPVLCLGHTCVQGIGREGAQGTAKLRKCQFEACQP